MKTKHRKEEEARDNDHGERNNNGAQRETLPANQSTKPRKKRSWFQTKPGVLTAVTLALWVAWPSLQARADDAAQQSSQAWYSWILAAFYGGFVKAWHWILGVLLALIDKALGSALDNIPQSWRSINFQPLINFLGLVNYYFPLDVMIGALTAYFIWYGLLLLYRVIKSWIPTVSG